MSGDRERRPIGELLDEVEQDLQELDPADTLVALRAVWHAFCVTGAAGELLSICADPDTYGPLWANAEPVVSTAVRTVETAPSLKARFSTEINPAGGPGDRLDDQAAHAVHRRILNVAAAIHAYLPRVAEGTTREGDRRVCRQAEVLAGELIDVYQGRLRSFLNPWRTSFGPGTIRIRGQGRRQGPGGGSLATKSTNNKRKRKKKRKR
ncbi:hypothetical protein [Actinomadura opuntiae]|uniref:hypothetical protein n=1 Tax=Actinomadura sp. OS1-43 TaxID=604315 RepID=UPI00255AA0BE|nr:hypothetical protein [Actinomadura sp. OS1-43]MDL4813163.1 hypothetical protein [Actinomadura sp. OS1-43]